MRPDDITDEEWKAGIAADQSDTPSVFAILTAQNELRDRRVRAHVIEEIAEAVETMPGVCEFDAEDVAGRVRAMNDTEGPS